MKKTLLILSFCLALTLPAFAANETYPYIQIIKNDGGKIHGAEEPQNTVKSSLRLEWYVLNDPGCPIQLLDAGVREYEQMGSYPITYHYQADVQMKVHEPITAYQVKFHLFNVFGQFVDELILSDVRDMEANQIYQQNQFFSRPNEKNRGALLKVVSYITYIRKADGTIWTCNKTPINRIVDNLTAGK